MLFLPISHISPVETIDYSGTILFSFLPNGINVSDAGNGVGFDLDFDFVIGVGCWAGGVD